MVGLRESKSGWSEVVSVAVGDLELCRGFLLLTFQYSHCCSLRKLSHSQLLA